MSGFFSRARIEAALAGKEFTEGPFSPDEYDLLQRWRRNAFKPTTECESQQFDVLTCRYYALLGDPEEGDAWHEAGHAVIGYALGYVPQAIYRQGDGTPSVAFAGLAKGIPDPDDPQREEKLKHWALVQVAGYISERRAVGHSDPVEASQFVNSIRNHQDHDAAMRRLEDAEREVEILFDSHWDEVGRLAYAILNGLPLEEMEIRRAIAGE